MKACLFLCALALSTVKAVKICFEETKSGECQLESYSENSSGITGKKASADLTSQIFADPFLGIISDFLPVPEYELFRLNKVTRAHFDFNNQYFAFWRKVSKEFNIPGLSSNDDLIWFHGASGFKNDGLVTLLFHALVEQRLFSANNKPICEFIIRNLSKFHSSTRQRLFQYLLSVEDYDLVIDLLNDHASTLFKDFHRDHFFPLLHALKTRSNFDELYKKLLRISRLKSGLFLTNFLARSIEAEVPVDLFIEALINDSPLLLDVFKIVNNSDDNLSAIFGIEDEIVSKLVDRSPDDMFLSSLTDFMRLLREIRHGYSQFFDFQVLILDNQWTVQQIGMIAEALVLGDKLDLFSELAQKYRGAIVDCFSEDLNQFIIPMEFFFEILKLLSSDEMKNFAGKSQFLDLCREYYKLVEIEESNVDRFTFISVRFEVEPAYASSGIPASFSVSEPIPRFSKLMNCYMDQIFKSSSSLVLLGEQLKNCPKFLMYLGTVSIGLEQIQILRNIEEEQEHLSKFMFSCFRFVINEVVQLFDSMDPLDPPVLNPQNPVYFKILVKLSQAVHFENFERSVKTDLASYLIPKLNYSGISNMGSGDIQTYAEIRLALRFIKSRYPDRLRELKPAVLEQLLNKEKSYLW
jgi:hypothetical protein